MHPRIILSSLVLIILFLIILFSLITSQHINPTLTQRLSEQKQTLDANVGANPKVGWTQTVQASFDVYTATAVPEQTLVQAVVAATQTTRASNFPSRTDSFGVEQVYVPAGCFQMGSLEQQVQDAYNILNSLNKLYSKATLEVFTGEQPSHQVCITQGYWLDKTEVTNEAYDAFVKSGGYTSQGFWSSDGWKWLQAQSTRGPDTSCRRYSSQPKQPRICVNYYEAEAYAVWRKGRLPTEAEWEYAARGPKGTIFPWGDSWDEARANTRDGGPGKTTAVCSYPAGNSWVGACDMAGNALEWVRDWYGDNYYKNRPRPDNDPTGPNTGLLHVLRGGTWNFASVFARTAYRYQDAPLNRVLYGIRVVG